MQLEFDDCRWPKLTKFRKACLTNRFHEMEEISMLGFEWYFHENPDGILMHKLALIFQTQYHANENNLLQLQELITSDPWLVNQPWTSAGWLPITQAVVDHGSRDMIRYLIDAGADLTLMVGHEGERQTVPDMARYGGHDEIASWLEGLINHSLAKR